MVQFYREYPTLFTAAVIGQPAVAQLPEPMSVSSKGQAAVAQIPWAHNVLLMQRVKDRAVRLWYAEAVLAHGWSRNILQMQIESAAHTRQGKATSNFALRLPPPQSDLVQQALKDPYLFDFLTLAEPFRERELETGLIAHLEKFLLELGQGFAFVGRQHHIEIGEQDFYIDLLFYHLRLRCFVVIELKRGAFKPEYAGKMNFYCSAVDDVLKHATDAPTIGLILCQQQNEVIAEYALRGVDKPIGVSTFDLTRALPKELASSLPSIEQIERELRGDEDAP
jgi:predicted nuclease of restriction endonuclease-like (RecB) superfamily